MKTRDETGKREKDSQRERERENCASSNEREAVAQVREVALALALGSAGLDIGRNRKSVTERSIYPTRRTRFLEREGHYE